MIQENDTTDEVFRRDPAAATAAALWRTRHQATMELYDEVRRLQGEGYMLSEIAQACGTSSGSLQHMMRTETSKRRLFGDPE